MGMKSKILILISLIFFASLACTQVVFAATTASQTITGTLGAAKQIVTNGGTIAATIDPASGNLSNVLNPGFRMITNTNSSQNVRMTSTCNTTGGMQDAFFGDGNSGTTFIVLTNSTTLPSIAAVTDAKSGGPTPAANAEVIVYAINKPADIAGQLIYTWDNGNQYYNAALTHKINTDTLLTIPAAAPRAGTFSTADTDGAYQATVTLSFV